MTDHDLTPEEIAEFPLEHAVRGYRVKQVDELLDAVADRLENLENELVASQRRIADAESRAESASETESTLKRTLVTAQRAAEDTVAEAEANAARLLAQAQEDADHLLEDARATAAEVERTAAEHLARAQSDAARITEDARIRSEKLVQSSERRVEHLRAVTESFRTAMQRHLDTHRGLLESVPVVPDDARVASPSSPSPSSPTSASPVSEDDVREPPPAPPGARSAPAAGEPAEAAQPTRDIADIFRPLAGPGDAAGDFTT